MSKGEAKHFMISNVPVPIRKAVRVAAALEDKSISDYCVEALKAAVKKSGVQIEEGD